MARKTASRSRSRTRSSSARALRQVRRATEKSPVSWVWPAPQGATVEPQELLPAGISFSGAPVTIRFQPMLSAYRGRLLSGEARGESVAGAANIRLREITLDSCLLRRSGECRRILLHEIFHFAWVRLGNPKRRAYEELLRTEFERGARGELGWSAEHRKDALSSDDRRLRTRRWREYVCESFCDTAAWQFGTLTRHPELTLASRHREIRRRWFAESFGESDVSI